MENKSGMIRAEMIVEGEVQSVGFRALVKHAAKQLCLRGFAKNLEDSVKIVCEGEKEAVYKLKNKINIKSKSNNLLSINVKNIKIKEEPATGEFKNFNIDYSGELTPFQKENLERLEVGSLLLSNFRDNTDENFNNMEQKYGEISSNMRILTEQFIESNKTNKRMVESLIEKLDKIVTE